MPEIIPNQTCKHEGKVYEEGETYDVSPELAYYFKMVGWLGKKEPPSGETVTLDVHDSMLGHTAEVT